MKRDGEGKGNEMFVDATALFAPVLWVLAVILGMTVLALFFLAERPTPAAKPRTVQPPRRPVAGMSHSASRA